MAKKDFSNANATLDNFITPETRAQVDGKPEPKKAPKKAKAEEVRSKRVQVVTTPSTYNAILKLAKKDYLSVNEVINRALKEHIERSK